MLIKSRVVLATLIALGLAAAVQAAGQTDTVKADPLRCWWRTSVAAIRVGEPFSVVLTCAVVETDAVTVVPNRTELEPDAMQLPPFDVIGGTRSDDLTTADERFFQYQYRLRLVSPDLFGKDIKLPALTITYRVRTRTNGELLEGKDLSYVLPDTSVRVLSLVPSDAVDIRDASPDTFEDIGSGLSRANLLRLVGGVLIGFAVLAALIAIARVFSGSRTKVRAARSVVSDPAILRGVGRELGALQQARRDGAWTEALTARLLTALRIISGYALDLPARPLAVDGTVITTASEGELTLRVPGFGGRDATIAGWVTPVVISEELARRQKNVAVDARRTAMLEDLQASLSRLTTSQYGRGGGDARTSDAAIDEALASGSAALRQLRIDGTWIARKLRTFRFKTARLEHKAWSR